MRPLLNGGTLDEPESSTRMDRTELKQVLEAEDEACRRFRHLLSEDPTTRRR